MPGTATSLYRSWRNHGGVMRFLFALTLLLFTASVQAELLMECERYTVENDRKEDRTSFRLSLNNSVLIYEKISGDDWFLSSPSTFKLIWVSENGLRAVAKWIATDYGSSDERWSPVYIIDVDFSDPGFRKSSHGGFADFSEIVSTPWKSECRRLN